VEPLRRLHDEVVRPIAVESTQGAWYRGWRVVSLDGSSLDVADERANDQAFGRPGASRGESAYLQLHFVSLVENGTHVLFSTRKGSYGTGGNHPGQGSPAAAARGYAVFGRPQLFWV
jgi:hypothetical protein